MPVSITHENDVTIAALEGSIDGKTAPVFREELRPALEGTSNLILDMSKVDYLSSAGLRLLLLIYREASARKGKVLLVGVAEDIRLVMSHTGFLNFFHLAQTQQEAMHAFV